MGQFGPLSTLVTAHLRLFEAQKFVKIAIISRVLTHIIVAICVQSLSVLTSYREGHPVPYTKIEFAVVVGGKIPAL